MREIIPIMRKKIKTSMMLWLGLFVLFSVTRLWRLTVLPSGIHVDEAGMAYDAWNLSQYGVDRYLKSWPVYFINFGGGQNALYTWICAGLFKIFGYHTILIRIPSVIFSFINLVFGVLIAKKVYPDRKYLPFLSGLLIVICPYFIMAGRLGLECNLLLGISSVFIYCLLQGLDTQKYKWYVFAGIAGGFILYTYALTYIFVPLFLLFLLAYSVATKQFHIKSWVAMGIPMFILALPLILVQMVNMFDLPEMYIGPLTITKLPEYRISELGLFSFENFKALVKSLLIGDKWLPYNSSSEYCNLYAVTIPLSMLGFISCGIKIVRNLKKRQFLPASVPVLWFSAIFIFECHIMPNVNKLNGVFFAMVLFAVEGIRWIAERPIFQQLFRNSKQAICGGFGIAYIICFFSFADYYYNGQYTKDNHLLNFFYIDMSEAIEYLKEHPECKGDATLMTEPEIIYALNVKLKPEDYVEWHFDDGQVRYVKCQINDDEWYPKCSYIVGDIYIDLKNKLKELGFTEIVFTNHSLFYVEGQ